MTKVDEHAVVPPVDEPARRRLAAALSGPGIVSALLFGSQATGTAASPAASQASVLSCTSL